MLMDSVTQSTEPPLPADNAEEASTVDEQTPPKPPWRPTKKQQAAYGEVLKAFFACARCSYFLAGYRVLFGLEKLQEAIDNRDGNELQLIWSEEMRRLLHNSYGWRIDLEVSSLRASCPECRRAYHFAAGQQEGEAATIEIELRPRTRH